MNATAARGLLAATLATTVLIAAWAAESGRTPHCSTAMPQPEARESAFAVGGLFAHEAVELTATGRARVAAFAQALDAADVEVIVVRVPLASDTPAAEARRPLASKRALALREELVRLGVAEKRIYTETAGPPTDTQPVVIETVALWSPMQVALRRTCSVPV